MIENFGTAFYELLYTGLFPYKILGLHGYSAALLEYVIINLYALAAWYIIVKGRPELNLS